MAVKENLKFEENLEVCYYDHSDHSNKRWNFTLRFSFYQEAYEYVKSKQIEDFDFNAKIDKLRNNTRKQCDFIAKIKKPDSGIEDLKKEFKSDFNRLEKKMNQVIQLLNKKASV